MNGRGPSPRVPLDPLRTLIRKGHAFDYLMRRGLLRPGHIDEALNAAEPVRRVESTRERIGAIYGPAVDRVVDAVEQRTVARDFADVDLRELAVDVIEAAIRVEP